MSRLRTPEEVCVEYAEAVADVRRMKRFMNDRENFCEHYEPVEKADYATNYPGYEGTSRNHCLEQYDNEDQSLAFYENEMCEKCKVRLAMRSSLDTAKMYMRSIRRSVETIGQRLIKDRG